MSVRSHDFPANPLQWFLITSKHLVLFYKALTDLLNCMGLAWWEEYLTPTSLPLTPYSVLSDLACLLLSVSLTQPRMPGLPHPWPSKGLL